jgi:hypothetical protein
MTGVSGGHVAGVVSLARGWLRVTVAGSHGSSLSVAAALGVLLLIVVLAVTAVLATRRPWRHIRPATGQPPRRPARHSRRTGSPAALPRAGRGAAPSGYFRDLGPEHPSYPGAGYLRAVGAEPPDPDTKPDNGIKVSTAAGIGLPGVPFRMGSD